MLSSVVRIGLICLSSGILLAQTAAEITGEVTDPSGAAVPNASVTATNTATNVARPTTTNSAGIYSFPELTPGTYQVRVAAAGFENVVKTNIELQVQQDARIDFTLAVGQATQTIEVSANAALLTTEDATVGTVIEQRRITELPLNGRNFFSLVALSPNVTYGFTPAQQASGRLGGTRSTLTMALSGARATWANYTLDGITNTDVDFNTYIVLPSVDALQEFKVQSGIYPAEFGREAGQVNVSTKPGTNEYHGTAFEFLRNNVLDARPYDFSAARAARPIHLPKATRTARINMASRWAVRFGFRNCSTARTGSSSCRISKAFKSRTDADEFCHHADAGHAERRFLRRPNPFAGSAFAHGDIPQHHFLGLSRKSDSQQPLRQELACC